MSSTSAIEQPLKRSRTSEIKNKQSFVLQFFSIDSDENEEPTIKCWGVPSTM